MPIIAKFPEFAPLRLDDRAPLTQFLRRSPPLASEYTFANLFAWRFANNYHLAQYGSGFLIRKQTPAGMTFLQPLVSDARREAVRDCLAYLEANSATPVIERVGEDFLADLGPGDGWTAQEDRDQFDYLYTVDELIGLPGERYHDKKNLLAQFQRKYTAHYRPFTVDRAPACIDFAHAWCRERRCMESAGLLQESCAVVQMLMHVRELELCGGVLEIDNAIAAFTLAERLNPDTLVIHAEKAAAGFTGIYQAIHWEFLRHQDEAYAYVNREQDLGIPNLRQAKLSYNPTRLIKKYRITRG